MIGEIDLGGVFIPILLVNLLIAVVALAVIRPVLAWAGVYRLVWHRSLFDFSLLVIFLAVVVLMPRWVQ